MTIEDVARAISAGSGVSELAAFVRAGGNVNAVEPHYRDRLPLDGRRRSGTARLRAGLPRGWMGTIRAKRRSVE